MRLLRALLFAALATALPAPAARADVKLPHLFSDGMVLQQAVECPVWGTAEPGEKVTVSFDLGTTGMSTPTTADKDGKWQVSLAKAFLKAGGPYKLTVKG